MGKFRKWIIWSGAILWAESRGFGVIRKRDFDLAPMGSLLFLFSHSVVSNSLQPHGLQHRLPWPSPSPRACSNSCPSSQWCHPTISSSVNPFSCLQSFPESGSFLMNQFFTSGGQSIRASASACCPSPGKKNLSPQRRENQRKKYSLLLEIRSTDKPERSYNLKPGLCVYSFSIAMQQYCYVLSSLNQHTFTLSQFLRLKILGQICSNMDDLGIVILSEVGQTEKEKYLICGIEKEMIQVNLLTKQKEIHRLREWIYSCWVEGIVREFGTDVYTLLYLKWITSKDLLYSTWDSTPCYVAAWLGQKFGGEWIHVYVWLGPFPVHLKLLQHC